MPTPARPPTPRRALTALTLYAALALTFSTALAAEPTAPAGAAPAERVAPETIAPGATCADAGCHGDKVEGMSVHPPAEGGECEMCHEADGNKHAFEMPFTGTELCYACHDDMTEGKVVHAPLDDDDESCAYCHDAHSSPGVALLIKPTVDALCLMCHDDPAGGDPNHRPGPTGGCTTCHEPHSSDHDKVLRDETPGLCYTCHDDIEARAKAAVVHGPMGLGCAGCHDVHAARAGKGLKETGPALCMSCHDHFSETYGDMAQHHVRLLTGKQCLACHDAHGTQEEALLRDKPVDLCLACHNVDITTPSGGLVHGLGALKDKDAQVHGPLKDGGCGGCHEPHGNDHPLFVREAYPGGFYAAYSEDAYALCFTCHDEAVAAKSRTTGDTEFRNGDLNLHYTHVNKARKGRTCRACHVAHAGGREHLIAESVPFGDWGLPVGFTATENGGTCSSGCHEPKTYDRLAPVDYAPPATGQPLPGDEVEEGSWTGKGAAPGTDAEPDGSLPTAEELGPVDEEAG